MRNPNVDCYENEPQSYISSSGDSEHILYSSVVGPDGVISLSVSSVEDIQSQINSYAAECELSNILARFSAGDVSALNNRPVSFGDFTNMPKSMIEAYNLIERGKESFTLLPESVRAAYDNDFLRWLADAGSNKWVSVMSESSIDVGKVEKPVIEKPVKEIVADA